MTAPPLIARLESAADGMADALQSLEEKTAVVRQIGLRLTDQELAEFVRMLKAASRDR